jgi:predicted amidophosphoribosyltransferase
MATTPAVADPELETDAVDEKQVDDSGPRIRCPLCRWSPGENDRWSCQCGHYWNTFDTGGICSGCLHQWTTTQCLACHRWAPHSDWYEQLYEAPHRGPYRDDDLR